MDPWSKTVSKKINDLFSAGHISIQAFKLEFKVLNKIGFLRMLRIFVHVFICYCNEHCRIQMTKVNRFVAFNLKINLN